MSRSIFNALCGATLGLLASGMVGAEAVAAGLDDAMAALASDLRARLSSHQRVDAPTPPGNDHLAPTLPSSFTAQPEGCGAIRLSWQPAVDRGEARLAGYEIYRGGMLRFSAGPSDRALVEEGLSASTDYEYEITAVDRAGNRSARVATSATSHACFDEGPVAQVVASATLGSGFSARGVSVDSDRGLAVLVGTGPSSWLEVVDSSDPGAPRPIGHRAAPLGNGLDVALAGTQALALVYTADAEAVELIVVELAEPRSPAISARLVLPGRFGSGAIDVVGTTAYVGGSESGLHLVDFADPRRPVLTATLPSATWAVDVETVAGTVYVLSERALKIYDASIPGAPELVFERHSFIGATDVAATDEFLYVIDSGNIITYELGDPQSPGFLGFDFFAAHSLAAVGQTIFATFRGTVGDGGRVFVLDASEPSELEQMGALETPGQTAVIEASGAMLYVSDYESLLDLVDSGL